MQRTLVRCEDRTVFPVNPVTLEPLSCGWYDPYCYCDPELGVRYIEHTTWSQRPRVPS
jgi:hypothetical protein